MALTPRGVHLEIHRSLLLTVHATSDVRGGGTAGEFIDNLVVDGSDVWNKWFSTAGFPTSVTFKYRRPVTVTGYAFKLGNDCRHRDPMSWQVSVATATGGDDALVVHTVADARRLPLPGSRYDWWVFPDWAPSYHMTAFDGGAVVPRPVSDCEAVTFTFTAARSSGPELQLSQIVVFGVAPVSCLDDV